MKNKQMNNYQNIQKIENEQEIEAINRTLFIDKYTKL